MVSSRSRLAVEPVVQATAFHRIVQITRAVAGQQRDGRGNGFERAQLRNADLVFAQIFQQEGFKGFIRTVNLINQQNRTRCGGLQGLQQWPPIRYLSW